MPVMREMPSPQQCKSAFILFHKDISKHAAEIISFICLLY